MIHGAVNARFEAIVPVRLRGPAGTELSVDAIVDTGFTASLTLPDTAIAVLGLQRQSRGGAVLADGSVRQFDIYTAEVSWAGAWRPVLVSGVGDEVLLGMRLLGGHKLAMAVMNGGLVEIAPLP
ncbi:MAG TPA: clan AA aspartic protease [Pirellulales bacterium]|nr:clan AA aspartic protease [Pirellulales bacterium]